MYYILITLLLCLVSLTTADETSVVVTRKGNIIGTRKDGYNTFFGVPYALVNESNPFGDSLSYPNFRKSFIANDSSIKCPQVAQKPDGQLQCLTLNIYVPQTATIHDNVPILVWFYGGGFVLGNANDYGGEHLVKHDIIVVTVNYRLGPYGFLCLNDESVPGNQGLKDQIAALKWVKENIKAFNGDPDKITIAGESYGGGAVDLHLYSKFETLFERAIIQSGSLFAPGFYRNGDYEAAIKLAEALGKKAATTKEALKVLTKENPISVMTAAKNLKMRFTPCKEMRFKGRQPFVTEDINHLSKPDTIGHVQIMIGYNSKEDFGTYANKGQDFYDKMSNIFYRNLKENFILSNCELKRLSNIVKTFYLGGKNISAESMLELSDYSSDFKLNYAAEKSVSQYLEQGGKPYKYMFSYIGGSPYQNVTGAGAIHTEELKYLFETAKKLTTDEQLMMRERMTTLWSNFVKFGNPTPTITSLLTVIWEPIAGNARPYLDIDVNMTMKDHAYKERMAFWELFMEKYNRKC